MSKIYDKVYGCLLGGMIGDAMGGPTEFLTYQEIEKKYGWVDSFTGSGTDDTVIRGILINAILKNQGYVTADEWAETFLEMGRTFYPMYYAPVRNMFHKLQSGMVPPVQAGDGNSPSSSSAMSISPMGIINACDPRRAAAETYDVAGMFHSGFSGFCRDGACAMAAAVAEAMKPNTTVDNIVDASMRYLHRKSAKVMLELIEESVEKVRGGMDYKTYRAWYYENCLQTIFCDSRETIPSAIAIIWLSGGDPQQAAILGANFGRDADTIATMATSVIGAYAGESGIKKEWIEQIEAYYGTEQSISSSVYGEVSVKVPDYRKTAESLTEIIKKRNQERQEIASMITKQ